MVSAGPINVKLRRTRENPLLKGVPLPEALKLTDDLAAAEGCGVVVLATPSFALRETARRLAHHADAGDRRWSACPRASRRTPSAAPSGGGAGDGGTSARLWCCPAPPTREEVGRGVLTAVVVASEDRAAAELVQDLFMNERAAHLHLAGHRRRGDRRGHEKRHRHLRGLLRRSGLRRQHPGHAHDPGLTEVARLGVAMGGRKETFAGLAGVGDLIVTCTSMHSRNCRAGMLIGQGVSAAEAVTGMNGAVVEGYYAAASARALAEKAGVEMPITQAIYEVLYEGRDPRTVPAQLMNRDRKNELELENSWI